MNKLVVGNLKMNILNPLERDRYLNLFRKELKGKKLKNIQLILCPPYVHIESFKKAKIKKIKIGAQNMFWERQGPFTGEVSPEMLRNLGCEYVIVGHSERRRYFSENNGEISLKVEAALKNALKPILCIGESKSHKEGGSAVIIEQLKSCLEKINRIKIENVIICYEPIWAISSNNPDHLPTTNEIMSARLLIKKFLVEKYGVKAAEKVGIIYGGSVSSSITKEVCLDPGMDGALVGRESLTPHELIKIAEIINK